MIHDGALQGMAVVLHQEPYHFSFDHFKLLQALIHHATLALTNSMLHEELQQMVITDQLTKLYTRNYLDDTLNHSMKNDRFGCFILLDIDDFKSINDSYGHQAGDEILIQVAQIIKNHTRDIDVAARWGGEELAVYLPKVDRQLSIQIARRLVDDIEQHTKPKVTVSCGISCWDWKEESILPRQLFHCADKALYKAKNAGKHQVVMFA